MNAATAADIRDRLGRQVDQRESLPISLHTCTVQRACLLFMRDPSSGHFVTSTHVTSWKWFRACQPPAISRHLGDNRDNFRHWLYFLPVGANITDARKIILQTFIYPYCSVLFSPPFFLGAIPVNSHWQKAGARAQAVLGQADLECARL